MKKAEPVKENLERWMVSYADFLTLMFAVFVVLYSFAMSKSIDAQSMIKGLMASFNEVGMISSVQGVIALPGPVANLMADSSLASANSSRSEVEQDSEGGGGVMDFGFIQQSVTADPSEEDSSMESNEDSESTVGGNLHATETDESTGGIKSNITPEYETDASSGLTAGGELDQHSRGGVGPAASEMQGSNASGQPFDVLMRSISETITENGLDADVIVERNPNWITINISSTLLFANNSASILSRSRPVIASIAHALQSVNNYIRVRGYTDNSFVPSAIYGNNWELSSRRAINVLQELEINGIMPQRLAAESYGQYSPFYSNATRAGRAQNRRVVIAISREAVKPETLAILSGNSEKLVVTRRAGQGGFTFDTDASGQVTFNPEPVSDGTPEYSEGSDANDKTPIDFAGPEDSLDYY